MLALATEIASNRYSNWGGKMRRNYKGKGLYRGDYYKMRGGYKYKGKYYEGKFSPKKHFGNKYKKMKNGYKLYGKSYKGNWNWKNHSSGHYMNGNWKKGRHSKFPSSKRY